MTDLATNVLYYGDNLDILRRYLPDAAVAKGDDFAELVKRTYRVLLTRGMKGCCVYFEDGPSCQHFATRITNAMAKEQSG
jgi:DUF2075 family protein